MTDLEALRKCLEDLSAELIDLGTPLTVRRDVKTLLAKLPVIEARRERKAARS